MDRLTSQQLTRQMFLAAGRCPVCGGSGSVDLYHVCDGDTYTSVGGDPACGGRGTAEAYLERHSPKQKEPG